MHIQIKNIEEAEKLMYFINDKILELKPDKVEILGDLFHNHSVIRLEVLEFWDSWLDILSESCELVVLRGNHDMDGSYGSDSHVLSIFRHLASKKRNLKIVHHPRLDGIYGYVSYTHSKDEFVSLANNLASQGAKVLICHQSFNTSMFENGTYDPEGIDPSLLNFNLIISGHIHKHQICVVNGKTIIHPGTPFWQTASDANENKGIWLYNHDDITGAIISSELIPTDGVVTKIVSLIWEEGKDMPIAPTNAKTTIELVGSSSWVNDQKKILKGQYAIKTKITDKISKIERKTGKNFYDFVSNLYVTNINRDILLKYMKENGVV